jgi:hypothetical protein
VRLAVLATALAAALASTFDPDPIPEPDSCPAPSVDGVNAIEIWDAKGERPLADGEVRTLTYGSQGGAMLVTRFVIKGSEVPACAGIRVQLDRCLSADCSVTDEEARYEELLALRTYDGSSERMTRELFIILPFAYRPQDLVHLRVEVGASSSELSLWLEGEGSFPDAGLPDAEPAIDAGAPDADVGDAAPGPDALSTDAGQ